jgi:hypothetical protein
MSPNIQFGVMIRTVVHIKAVLTSNPAAPKRAGKGVVVEKETS